MVGSGGSRHRLIFDALPGLTINTYNLDQITGRDVMTGCSCARIASLLVFPKIPIRSSPSTKQRTVGMHRIPYHRPRFGLSSSLTRAIFKQSDSLAISSRTPFNIMEGKAHP